jgi:hypothetical protein
VSNLRSSQGSADVCRLADAMEANDNLQAEHAELTKSKLAALERTLGISSESGQKREGSPDLVEIAAKRHKFHDNEYFEESRELKEGVRSAVSAGELPFVTGVGVLIV